MLQGHLMRAVGRGDLSWHLLFFDTHDPCVTSATHSTKLVSDQPVQRCCTTAVRIDAHVGVHAQFTDNAVISLQTIVLHNRRAELQMGSSAFWMCNACETVTCYVTYDD
jgi:hypothetical protein